MNIVFGDIFGQFFLIKLFLGWLICFMMFLNWVVYDIYYYCDSCRNYCEGMGMNMLLSCVYILQCGEKLQFIILYRCLYSFIFIKEKQLWSFCFFVVLMGGYGEVVKQLKMELGGIVGVVKSFIMMLSIGRYEYGESNFVFF